MQCCNFYTNVSYSCGQTDVKFCSYFQRACCMEWSNEIDWQSLVSICN